MNNTYQNYLVNPENLQTSALEEKKKQILIQKSFLIVEKSHTLKCNNSAL